MEPFQNIKKEVEDLIGIKINKYDIPLIKHILKTALLITAHYKKGDLDDTHVANLSLIFERSLNLQLQALKGDESAKLYYQALEKLIFPPKMIRGKKNKKKPFLPIVKDILAGYHSSPELIRAYEIRRIMSQLSFIVEIAEPICNCMNSGKVDGLLKILFEINEKDIKISADDFCQCYKLKPKSRIKLRESNSIKKKELFIEAVETIKETYKSKLNFSWEGLAKKIYLRRQFLDNPHSNLSEDAVNRSLLKLKKFEEKFPEQISDSLMLPVLNGDDLPYQILTPFKL